MRRNSGQRLVIDADVAQSSGGVDSTFPRSKQCRDFLMALRKLGHRIVMTPEIYEEWSRHNSKFARAWLVSMRSIRKVEDFPSLRNENLRSQVQEHSTEETWPIVSKDCHLVEAALQTDQKVCSCDETARRCFMQIGLHIESVGDVIWVNPTQDLEEPLIWLESGAPFDPVRQLKNR